MPITAMNFANDLGYSAVKGTINRTAIKVPSVMAVQRQQDIYDPLDFDEMDVNERNQYMGDFLKHLDVAINSPAVETKSRLLVGDNARRSSLLLTSFDVNDMSGKAENDLSVILTLSLLAGEAVRESYGRDHKLPSQMSLSVNMATALPILEGKRDDAIAAYKSRYLDYDHLVVMNNFTQPITIKIHFNRVEVALEGEAAQYELKHAVPQLQTQIKQDFDKHYPELASSVTSNDIIQSQNVMGIDIGEGTTDYVVFDNGHVNEHSSTSMPKGYGNALEEAIEDLRSQRFSIDSRAQLQAFLSEPINGLNRSKHQIAGQAVVNQMNQLASSIVEGASQTLRKTSINISLIYVYGGGATPLEPYLRKALMKKTRQFTAGDGIPVIWIASNFAQYMNEAGLQLILSFVLNNAKK